MGFIKALVLLIIIPIFGFIVSNWVLSTYDAELEKQGADYSITQLCKPEVLSQNPNLQTVCSEVNNILLMKKASIFSGLAAIALLLSFVLAARMAGQSRTKITKIFPPLVFVSLAVMAVLVLVQGAILTYGAYLTEVTAINRVHYFLIGGIGIGTLIGGFGLIRASFKLAAKQTHDIIGTALDPEKHQKLYTFVKDIAEKLGARKPDHIVVGLEPNFYVTSADVEVAGDDKKLKGETLFLSLPLARIFSKEEIKAVIGHELGHFRGQDTYYSLKFSPVYAGLTQAIASMSNEGGGSSIMDLPKLPARVVLSYMMDVFHQNISTISREREFEADKASAEVAKPKALATSLLKINLYAHAWNNLEQSVVARMQKDKRTYNMSQLFSGVVKYDINKEHIHEVIGDISKETVSHPTDSHPPTVSRIEALGLKLSDIDHNDLLIAEESSIDLVDDYKAVEESLTDLQQQYYQALGVQVAEENENNNSHGATLLAALGAHMVVADGIVKPEEIDQAEAIGVELAENFDIIEFREYCNYPEHLPAIEDLIEASSDLDKEFKQSIIDYLAKIAVSDSETSSEEVALLSKVKKGLGL